MRPHQLVVFAAAAVMAAAAPSAEQSSVSFTKTWVLPSGVPKPHHTRPFSQYEHLSEPEHTGIANREAKEEVKTFATVLAPGQSGSVDYDPHVVLPYATDAPPAATAKPHHTRPWSQYRDSKAEATYAA